ncbi:hypothetical protein SAMN05421823_11561 [Catalinimonas alkaloidigena]|uniref:Uncharacterized protein n=1 Tax=Catalinimonas alkaloidigena TaxID=1075417 RepID=A0A1G9U1S8_9BACT|nr:hypothetical protein [Catalinimonas alkaloidigena]SDM53947.1 hypothetical protein SAMN05421823_11561 [Catalinimonas alkaloidigena]
MSNSSQSKSKDPARQGRPRVEEPKLRRNLLKVYLSDEEEKAILAAFEASGKQSLSEYTRDILLARKTAYINVRELLTTLSKLGQEVSGAKAEVTKIADQIRETVQQGNILDDTTVQAFTCQLEAYVRIKRSIDASFRKLIQLK